MYELPMSLDLIPNLQLEGAALVRDLTGFLMIWAAMFVMLYLVVIPLACRGGGTSDVIDDQQPDGALRRAA